MTGAYLSMNILCVDNDIMAVTLLEDYCAEIAGDYNFYSFTDEREALLFAKKKQIDIALIDKDMPFISGIEFAKKLKSHNRYINIIMTSSYANYTMEAYALDCAGYLVKPISLKKLKQQFDKLHFTKREEIQISISCTGKFCFLINNETPNYKYNKSLELLAYLIYRKGALCSISEIEENLWDDNGKHSEYRKKLKTDLLATLKYYGIDYIIKKRKGYIGINTDAINCDLIDYYRQNPDNPLPDIFLTDYKWAHNVCVQE